MPHLILKYFPRNLSEAKKQALIDELAKVVKKHLACSDDDISIDATEVSAEDWQEQVYDIDIKPFLDRLAKKPGYNC